MKIRLSRLIDLAEPGHTEDIYWHVDVWVARCALRDPTSVRLDGEPVWPLPGGHTHLTVTGIF